MTSCQVFCWSDILPWSLQCFAGPFILVCGGDGVKRTGVYRNLLISSEPPSRMGFRRIYVWRVPLVSRTIQILLEGTKVGRTARKPLSVRRVETETQPGYYADSTAPGLYLQVSHGVTGTGRSWIFRYTSPTTQKRREMGLGPTNVRKLAEVRSIVLSYRAQILAGQDPLDERQAARAANTLARSKQITFEQAAAECIKAKSPEWRNPKHRLQWVSTLTAYAHPKFGKVPVNLLTTEAIYEALKPIWQEKTETATRVRQRIEMVWDWAKARGYCSGENPARLRGGLGELLPKSKKIKRVKHHPALPYQRINTFMKDLRATNGTGRLAFELMILTATRTSEVIGARWEEIDMEAKVWAIPGDRMKAGKEHRIPLSTRAVQILKAMEKGRTSDYVFPGQSTRHQKHLSTGIFLSILKNMKGYEGITPHGFRSTFRDWAAETTAFANETLELALAHAISNQTEASYRRQDQLEKRRLLMQSWEKFIDTFVDGTVIPINRQRAT
jgi:integrase